MDFRALGLLGLGFQGPARSSTRCKCVASSPHILTGFCACGILLAHARQFPSSTTGAEAAAGINPGRMQPTPDEMKRFEAAMDAAFCLGGNALSPCSDGVSEFNGVKFAAIRESILDFNLSERVWPYRAFWAGCRQLEDAVQLELMFLTRLT